MLGVLRTTLALMVMVFHLWMDTPPLGTFAVFGFYVISGFLMTLTMHTSYGYTASGRMAFALNRFLRLYPPYWIAAGLSVLLIMAFGREAVRSFHSSIYLPGTWREIAQNLLMVFPAYHPETVDPRLVPPTWALTVEIFFYALICAGISKTLWRVSIWLLLSVGYVVVSLALGLPERDRYFPVTAASLPFAVGALAYFASTSARARTFWACRGGTARILFAVMLLNLLVCMLVSKTEARRWVELGQYLNVVLCGLLVFAIATGDKIARISPRLDQVIGDFSYPIYLLHWQCGFLVTALLYGHSTAPRSAAGLIALLMAMLLAGALSVVLIKFVDPGLQALRARIRPKASLSLAR